MTKVEFKWLRWLTVLPASICIPAFSIFLPGLLPHLKLDGVSSANFTHALYPFATSIISILIAYVIAPTHKFKASLAIAILWLLILSTALSIVIFKFKVAGEQQYVLDNGMATISTFTGIIIGLVVSWKAESKLRKSINELMEANRLDLPEPWFWTDIDFTAELKAEVNSHHVLFNQELRSIAKREDNDDVLFELLNNEDYKYTIVHLTWSSTKQDGIFPRTKLYTNWDDLYNNGILVDAMWWSMTSG